MEYFLRFQGLLRNQMQETLNMIQSNWVKKYTILIFLKIALIGTPCQTLAGSCDFQNRVLQTANKLFESGQFLLSATQYPLLFESECEDLSHKSLYNYSLSMAQLGEMSELTRIYSMNKSLGLKTVIEFVTSDGSNPRVNFWINMSDPESIEQINQEANFHKLRQYHQEYLNSYSHKSPWLAGLMSTVLPGLGQFYIGSYQSAAVSLLLNGLFLWSTFNFVNKDLEGAAFASGFVLSITYVGNILNAVRGANKINQVATKPLKTKIKESLFPELKIKK